MNRITEAFETHIGGCTCHECVGSSEVRGQRLFVKSKQEGAKRHHNKLETAILCEVLNFLKFSSVITLSLTCCDFSFVP